MDEFKESKFYKLLQDFFINNNKETFLQMLAEFYNRTEGIIEKNVVQDEIIKELRELYLEISEKGIDENIVREKVNYYVENNVKIQDILAKLVINTNKIENNTGKIENNTEKLNTNTNNIENINSQLDTVMTNINNIKLSGYTKYIAGDLKKQKNEYTSYYAIVENSLNLNNEIIPIGIMITFDNQECNSYKNIQVFKKTTNGLIKKDFQIEEEIHPKTNVNIWVYINRSL